MRRPAPLTRLGHLVGGLALAATLGAYLLLDRLAAISLYPVAVALFAALGLLALAPLLPGRRRAAQVALPAALLCAVLAVQLVNWDSRKPFLRALHRIEPGMTVEQADAIMAGFIRTPAEPGRTSAEGMVSYRHTDQGWGNSDIGLIAISGGRVVTTRFLPD